MYQNDIMGLSTSYSFKMIVWL